MSVLDEMYQLARHRGWSIRMHNHPKTRENWHNDWSPHDTKSVPPEHPDYGKPRAR